MVTTPLRSKHLHNVASWAIGTQAGVPGGVSMSPQACPATDRTTQTASLKSLESKFKELGNEGITDSDRMPEAGDDTRHGSQTVTQRTVVVAAPP